MKLFPRLLRKSCSLYAAITATRELSVTAPLTILSPIWSRELLKIQARVWINVYFNIEQYRTGERLLTRNGQFTINAEGYLTLGTCGYVLDENGERIQLGTADFQVDRFGQLTTDDGRTFNIGLSYIPGGTDIEKVDDNLMRPYQDTPIGGDIPERYRIMQGWFERSNVDVAEETIKAMDSQHIFTACSTALKIINSVNQMAANDLAKIN